MVRIFPLNRGRYAFIQRRACTSLENPVSKPLDDELVNVAAPNVRSGSDADRCLARSDKGQGRKD